MNVMRAAVVADYVDLARQLGLEPEAQLRAVGLSTHVIGTPDRHISSDAAVRLLENSAAASGCQTLGLRMSQLRRMSHFGVVGLLFRPVVFYGGRTAADIPLRDKFAEAGFEVRCSTDDGSFGFSGFVTGLVGRELAGSAPDIIYSCGPNPMMKALAGLAAEYRVPAEFSLESLMGCGIGACWGCVHRIKADGGEGWVKICEEGPVFPLERIVWP